MKLTKKELTTKYTVFCLLIVLGALLQNVRGLWFQIGEARCFFLVPLTILLGIDEDERTAAAMGLLAGLLWDTVSAQHMGYNAIFLMIACFISSAFVTYLLRGTYWVGVVFSVLFSFLYVLVYWLLFVVTKGGTGAVSSFGWFYIPCFIYTAVVAFVLNLFLVPLKRKLNKEPKEEK